MDARRIEVSLSQDKINLKNGTYQKELGCWKDAALKMALDGDKANQLKGSAPFFLLIRKPAKKMDIDEIISYLKFQYLTSNKDQVTFVKNLPSIEEVIFLKRIQEALKIISEYMKDDENMSLRNKALFGRWMSVARKICKRDKVIEGKNLPQ